MCSWRHIPETELMQNRAIQISNDVTVMLFLDQSSQNFELFLEMINTTTAQNSGSKKCFTLPRQHIL